MSCSKAEARECWTLPQFLKVTNDEEFAEYAAKNYILDEDSSDAAEQEDSSGHFSDEELQEDEKEEVTDDDFFNLLNQTSWGLIPQGNPHLNNNILIWRKQTILLTRWSYFMTQLCLS